MSQCADLLAVLADGHEHEMRQIHARIGFCRLNSRVSELRARGHLIVCRKERGEYHYRLLAPLGEQDAAVAAEGLSPLPSGSLASCSPSGVAPSWDAAITATAPLDSMQLVLV